jgi:DNA-directed RNA polymerase specialized sigma24 family protein
MGNTGTTNGEPGLARDGAAPRAHTRESRPPGASQDGPVPGACPALADLYHAHYGSLIRLATLLTGDRGTAEAVVVDSYVALHRLRKNLLAHHDALPYLRRLVVARSRPAARHHRPTGGERFPATAVPSGPAGAYPGPAPESSAVLLALRALPLGQREAVVLTLYLHLTEEPAATAMQVSPATLRHYLAGGKAALRAALPGIHERPGQAVRRGNGDGEISRRGAPGDRGPGRRGARAPATGCTGADLDYDGTS